MRDFILLLNHGGSLLSRIIYPCEIKLLSLFKIVSLTMQKLDQYKNMMSLDCALAHQCELRSLCSILLPSKLVWSFAHQFVKFALKSPIATKKRDYFAQVYLRFFQNFHKSFQKQLETDLVICREQQNYMSCPNPHFKIYTFI